MKVEPETPHILETESTNDKTENVKSNSVDPFTSAFKGLKEPTLVIDETSDITGNNVNHLFIKEVKMLFFHAFCILLIYFINIELCLENLEKFTFQVEESKNKENSLSTNENTKASHNAENHDVAEVNTPHTDEEVVDRSTQNRGSTQQEGESFDEKAEEKLGE